MSCLVLQEVWLSRGAQSQDPGEDGAEPGEARWSVGGLLGDREVSRWLSEGASLAGFLVQGRVRRRAGREGV